MCVRASTYVRIYAEQISSPQLLISGTHQSNACHSIVPSLRATISLNSLGETTSTPALPAESPDQLDAVLNLWYGNGAPSTESTALGCPPPPVVAPPSRDEKDSAVP